MIAPSSWSESRIRNPSNPSPSCKSWGTCCYIRAAQLTMSAICSLIEVTKEMQMHSLVPETFLVQVKDGARPRQISEFDEWLKALRKTWGVSTEVMLRRLLDAGRLPQAQYAAYREWRSTQPVPEQEGGSRKYRHREPSHIFGNTFVRTVLDALHGQYITLAKASHYLDGLKINDLHQLERY